jgi:hypothetical protein
VAVALFAVQPLPFVTRTQYLNVPFVAVGGRYEFAVAPLIGVVVLGLVPEYHWYVSEVPVAVAVMRWAAWFRVTVCSVGEKPVMAGTAFTTTAFAAEVAVQPLTFDTVTV